MTLAPPESGSKEILKSTIKSKRSRKSRNRGDDRLTVRPLHRPTDGP